MVLEEWYFGKESAKILINNNEFPLLHNLDTPEKWRKEFKKGLDFISKNFPVKKRNPDHTILGDKSSFYLFNNGDLNDWASALNKAGRTMQDFRNRWNLQEQDTTSDYYRVKSHLAYTDPKAAAASPKTPTVCLTNPPERCAFGLPLTFRYSSLKYQKGTKPNGDYIHHYPEITFQGKEHERSASPIFVRIVKIKEAHYPFFACLESTLLAHKEVVTTQKITPPWTAPSSGFSSTIISEFCKNILKPACDNEVVSQ